MNQLQEVFQSTILPFLQQFQRELLIGVVVVAALLLTRWVHKRLTVRNRLSFSGLVHEWRTFRKYHIPRQVRSTHNYAIHSVDQQMNFLVNQMKQDLSNVLVLLSPIASGKTWTLFEVISFLRRKRKRWIMVSLESQNCLETIRKIPRQDRTWLILDDLEAWHPELQQRERIDEILEVTQNFKAVIFAADPDRWPKTWQEPGQFGRIKLVGEDQFTWAISAWLLDWTVPQAQHWLRKYSTTANTNSLRRVIDGIDWRNTLWSRPAVLKTLTLSAGIKGPSRYLFEVVRRSIQKAVGASGSEEWWGKLESLAVGEPAAVSGAIPTAFKQILRKDSSGKIIFKHRLFKGFFIARHALSRADRSVYRELRAFPEARIMFLEQSWSSFLELSGPEPGWALPGPDQARIPLRALSIDMIEEMKYLELTSVSGLNFQFLRLLPNLSRIWILDGSETDLARITDHWRPVHGARCWMKVHGRSWFGLERIIRFDEKKRWDPLMPVTHFHPVNKPAVSTVRGPYHPFRQLFRLDPDQLPNLYCRPVEMDIEAEAGIHQIYELPLGSGEFDLFDKAFVYEFETGDIHLQYLHSRQTNSLIPLLQSMLERWVIFIGPDDEGKRDLEEAEIMEIQQGYWLGRHWLRTDLSTFDRQVMIHLPRPGALEIWIRNGAPATVDQVSRETGEGVEG